MKNKKHLFKSIHKTFPVLLIILTIYTAATPETAFAEQKFAPKIEAFDQDDFDKKFRAGRDLIDKEEWAHAAETFREITEKYPNGKSVDAALYWLAFCHKKQKQFKEADAALDQLLKNFPNSSWTSDARVMKLEIAVPRAGTYTAAIGLQSAASVSGTLSAAPLTSVYNESAQTYVRAGELVEILNNSSARAPLDREDEIKIAAFQSLLSADPKRAIETMGEILRTDSKASETLKLEILRVLRAPRLTGTQTLGFTVAGNSGITKEFVPLVRDALIKGLQNESSVKLRKEMVYSLANLDDNQSTEYLKKRYADESDREIKKAIIGAFSTSANVFYGLSSDHSQTRKNESGVLMEIVRSEKDLELRQLAFTNLQRFPNWSADAQTLETLARLYDSETDEGFKVSIIRSLTAVKQNQATRKLLDIARNEKSDKLKLEAIYALRNSKDPEALRFLEELIK